MVHPQRRHRLPLQHRAGPQGHVGRTGVRRRPELPQHALRIQHLLQQHRRLADALPERRGVRPQFRFAGGHGGALQRQHQRRHARLREGQRPDPFIDDRRGGTRRRMPFLQQHHYQDPFRRDARRQYGHHVRQLHQHRGVAGLHQQHLLQHHRHGQSLHQGRHGRVHRRPGADPAQQLHLRLPGGNHPRLGRPQRRDDPHRPEIRPARGGVHRQQQSGRQRADPRRVATGRGIALHRCGRRNRRRAGIPAHDRFLGRAHRQRTQHRGV